MVPASSANVGCAFDSAAIALNLYLRVSAMAQSSAGFAIEYEGENAAEIRRDESNLVVAAMQRFAASRDLTLPGARLEIRNEIPLGVGLGSSAAAIVAGIFVAAELCNVAVSAAEALRLALEIEGHPDNVAAALHGGFVVSAVSAVLGSGGANGPGREVVVAKANVSPELDFIAAIPDVPLPTEKARAALPAQYSRQDVVQNLQRTALLTACFFSGQAPSPELFCDRLHQPYRSPLVPGISECLDLRQDGLLGVFLSGAGSSVMAIAKSTAGGYREIRGFAASAGQATRNSSTHSSDIGNVLAGIFRRNGVAARVLLLKAENRGTRVGDS